MSAPRILHIASWYPSQAHPTLGNFVEQQVRAIAPHTHSHVLHAAPFGKWEISNKREHQVPVTRVYFKKRLPIFSMLLAYYEGYRAIQKKGFDADLIHLHVVWPAGLFCLILRKKFVITEHYSGYHPQSPTKLKGILKWVSKLILSKAEATYTVSQHLAKAMQTLHPHGRYSKISNVVNTHLFKFSPSQRPSRPGFLLLHISSLTDSVKNFSGLLRAFAKAQEKQPALELYIGGDGNLQFLQKVTQKYGGSRSNIHIFGTKEPREVSALMHKCDALVLFSRIENQPVVMLESLCCGRPVIATRVGGIAEEIDHSNGRLVDSEDEKALTESMIEMAHNYERYRLRSIAQKAQSLYSKTVIGREFCQAYDKVLNPK